MRFALPLLAIAATASIGHAQVMIPNEFESEDSRYAPLFAYFGGVASFSTTLSDTTIHSGRSLQCTANFRHDNIFRVAGFAVGTLGVTRTGGALGFAAAADTFSVTIQSPPAPYVSGQLQLLVALREDDDGDGIIDTVENDDQWEADGIAVLAGTHIYNIPLAQFVDADPFAGNNVRNFGTTGMMALLLTFETRTTYPGGIIETPQMLLVDHVGLFVGPQSLPTRMCGGDWNGVGGVTVQDLFDYLTDWFATDSRADIFNVGDGVTLSDLLDFLIRWFTPCP